MNVRNDYSDSSGGLSGYGHSGVSGHSGYGGYENSYKHYDSYDCCPLVVDPLAYISLISFLSIVIFFLRDLIEMSNLMMRRRKKRGILCLFKTGNVIS